MWIRQRLVGIAACVCVVSSAYLREKKFLLAKRNEKVTRLFKTSALK